MKRTYLIPLAVVLLMVFMTMPVSAAIDEELDEKGRFISWDEESDTDSDINRNADSMIEPNFGGVDGQIEVAYNSSCTPIRSSYTYDTGGDGWRYADTGSRAWYDCSANIPQGAKMTRIGVEAYDNDASADMSLWFFRASFLSSSTDMYTPSETSGASTTRQYLTVELTSENITIDYETNSYGARVRVEGDSATQFRSVDFQYQLQISPAPATATFNDVSTSHWAFREIEALADSGITAGCGSGNFCPTNNVTREQMAVFLARALGLHYW